MGCQKIPFFTCHLALYIYALCHLGELIGLTPIGDASETKTKSNVNVLYTSIKKTATQMSPSKPRVCSHMCTLEKHKHKLLLLLCPSVRLVCCTISSFCHKHAISWDAVCLPTGLLVQVHREYILYSLSKTKTYISKIYL